MKKRHAIERFEEKFSPEPNTGCWIWFGADNGGGYGSFAVSKTVKIKAHRYSWQAYKSAIPEGMQVLHRCDNPGCVNPDHLFLGTQSDNIRDMVKKGRQRGAVGTQHANAKLNDDAVKLLREKKSAGASMRELIAEFGIQKSMIQYVCNRTAWKHVP